MKEFYKDSVLVMEKEFGKDQARLNRNQPIFSLDNASVHNDLEDIIGVGPYEHAPLPPRSPDMHKVIEHIFNLLQYRWHYTLCPAFCEDYNRNPGFRPPQYWNIIEGVLRGLVTRDSIRADIMTLHDTYSYIVAHNGARAPRPFN